MAELNIIFDVPETIAEGLRNGVYERIGGVIRRVGDKQIVMWLQEGVLLERDTAEQLLKQGAEHTELLRQQSEQLQMLGVQQQVIMGLQVANLAVSVAGFALTLYKLQGIESQLRHMDGKLDDIRRGVEWLDVRQMISRLAPLHASLQHVGEAGLYRNVAMQQQQLGLANSQLAESQSYFGGLLQHVSERSFEYLQPGEFAAAYRGWVMSAQGRLQVLARLGEMDLAVHIANEFKERHARFGQQLQKSLKNPELRLMAGQQGETNHARLLGIAEQAIGAHEIIRGNVMQLEFMCDEQLDLPILDSPPGYQGLSFCRVG